MGEWSLRRGPPRTFVARKGGWLALSSSFWIEKMMKAQSKDAGKLITPLRGGLSFDNSKRG